MAVVRVHPHHVAGGAAQMERDRALLAWAGAAENRLALRTYAFSRPTLSLGRSEAYPAGWRLGAIEAAGVEVVRRPTGGDAVLHVEEVTFAVASSLAPAAGLTPRVFSMRVAAAIASAVRELGLPAERIDRGESDSAIAPDLRSCFARPARDEVRVGTFKVAGIAAKITRGAALAHGSIPRTGRFREVAGLRDGGGDDARRLMERARGLEELLGGPLDEERFRARLLALLAESLCGDTASGGAATVVARGATVW